MNDPKEGDRVITAYNLEPGSWDADMLRRRKPDTRGFVQSVCGSVCTVIHDGMVGANRTAQYYGYELQPCPTEETKLDKLFRRVAALEDSRRITHRRLVGLEESYEQLAIKTPEPDSEAVCRDGADRLNVEAAVEACRPWCELTKERRMAITAAPCDVSAGSYAEQALGAALDAVPELVRAVEEQPSPAVLWALWELWEAAAALVQRWSGHEGAGGRLLAAVEKLQQLGARPGALPTAADSVRDHVLVAPPVLQAYQGLHREATVWWSAFDALRTRGDRRVAIEELSCAEENLHDALQTLEELGVRPGQTSGPEPQLYRRVCQALHVDEDSMPISELADLVMGRCQLHDRLSDPGAYGIEDPAALANVALAARESVQGLTTEVEILKRAHDNCAAEIVELLDVPATTADGDKMGIAELIPCIEELARTQRELAEKLELTTVGIRELTDAPPDVDYRDALEAAANRIAPVTHLLECYGPRELRGVAAGLYKLCDTSSPGYAIADATTTIAVMADTHPPHEPDSLAGLRGTGPAKASSR
jgi:hypothetical protein